MSITLMMLDVRLQVAYDVISRESSFAQCFEAANQTRDKPTFRVPLSEGPCFERMVRAPETAFRKKEKN
jgi:hypothetical protein